MTVFIIVTSTTNRGIIMKVYFRNESGQEEVYNKVESFDELCNIIEDNKLEQYGVTMYDDDIHSQDELDGYYYDLSTVAESRGW
jgi:hypothetical protein